MKNNNNKKFLIGSLVLGAIATATTLLLKSKSNYERARQKSENNHGLIWGGIAAGAFGALTLLLNHKTGKKLRKDIYNRIQSTRRKVGFLRNSKNLVNDLASNIQSSRRAKAVGRRK